jgi:hypothetical protein
MENQSTRQLIISGLLVSVGVLLPIIFHSVNLLGKIFLPMHIPVLVGGFFLSPIFAMVVGMMTPLLSALITGMPVLFPMAVIMFFELGSYGFVIASLRKKGVNIYIALVAGMGAGRLMAGFVVYLLSHFFGLKLNAMVFIKGAIMTGVPGIAIQLIIIPLLVSSLKSVLKEGSNNV